MKVYAAPPAGQRENKKLTCQHVSTPPRRGGSAFGEWKRGGKKNVGEEAPLFSLVQQSPASSVSDGLLRERSYWSNRTVGVPLFPSVESHRPESVQGVNIFFRVG